MDIQSINDDIKTRQWIERIKECRESGLPVRKWCKQNNICEQTYCWLKKLRKMAIESGTVKAPSFVSVDQNTFDKQNIVITKGDVRIEFPCDTDMRKQVGGLSALVTAQFRLEPFLNSIFLFCGRNARVMKVLYWEGDGLVLLYKRLENGRFKWPRDESEAREITP